MARRVSVKLTTQGRAPTVKRGKDPTLMEAGEAQQFQKTATLPIRNTKQPLAGPLARYKRRTVHQLMVHRVDTTARRLDKLQTAISMPPSMATLIRTPAAVGRTVADRKLARTVGVVRTKAGPPLPLAEAAAEGGLRVQTARAAGAVVGAVAAGAAAVADNMTAACGG